MNLPVLPTDRLYKLKALGGVTLVVTSLVFGGSELRKLVVHGDQLGEQLALLEVDLKYAQEDVTRIRKQLALLDSDAKSWQEDAKRLASMDSVAFERSKELGQRVAILSAKGRALGRDTKLHVSFFVIVVLLCAYGFLIGYQGFSTWSRRET